MKVIVIHLSDIHFASPGMNSVAERVSKIKGAIQELLFDARAVFILVTGDIAFAGKANEYKIAQGFLEQLSSEIQSLDARLVVHTVVLPGNHDCDFSTPNPLRDLILDKEDELLSHLKLGEDSIVRSIVGVQDNFFTFQAGMEKLKGSVVTEPLVGSQRLYYERVFTIEDRIVRFNCYNSAWMSRLHEPQAKLFFPLQVISPSNDKCDLAVAAFHHPTLWLESNNSREFRTHVEVSADIIFTGHEHVADQYTKRSIGGTFNEYVEGALLQGKPADPSGFNIVEVEIERGERRITEFAWNRSRYEQALQTEWAPLLRNKNLRTSRFQNNADFLKGVTSPGAAFLHRAKSRLTLADIYVYPDLSQLPLDKKGFVSKRIQSDRVLDFVLENPQLLITGSNVSGKSSLAHTLYLEMQRHSLVPVLLNGGALKKKYENGLLSKLAERTFAKQYDDEDVESYRQTNPEQRVLLIDDFHLSRLDRHDRNRLLGDAKARFGRVIVFANESFLLEEFAPDRVDQSVLLLFQRAEIKDFGFELRYRLIEKWITLEQDHPIDEAEVDRKISEAENLTKTLLGKNLVPSRPFFILSMLQVLEAKEQLNTGQSAYAYFYEVNIMQSLAANHSKAIPVDIITSFVSWIAFRMLNTRRRYLTELEFEQVATDYCSAHAVNFSRDPMKQVLQDSQVLSKQSDGSYRFSYKHVYYYFVAKYLATNLNAKGRRKELRRLITKITGRLYVEDYANFVLFFVYLSKDEKTIEQILAQAKSLYLEYEPSDLDEDLKFLGQLQMKHQPVRLRLSNPRDNRKEMLRSMDEVDDSWAVADEPDDEDTLNLEEEREIDDIVKINVSFKTMQIMGQILRNFPGALNRQLKRQLTQATYDLGLRSLKMIFQLCEDNIQELRALLAEAFIKGSKELDERELAQRTDSLIHTIVLAMSYGIIKRISFDVGSKHLSQTYAEVLQESGDSSAVALIDLSIKLDHFAFPKAETLALNDATKKNAFAHSLLRKMVRDRFYLHYSPIKVRQEVSKKLGIEFSDPKMIESKTRGG